MGHDEFMLQELPKIMAESEAVDSINWLECPNCKTALNSNDWINDAMASPINIVCADCDFEFSIHAKPLNVLWTIGLPVRASNRVLSGKVSTYNRIKD